MVAGREERSPRQRYISKIYSRERIELFLRFETSSCRVGPPVVREWWRNGYWFSICILCNSHPCIIPSYKPANQASNSHPFSLPRMKNKKRKRKEKEKKRSKAELGWYWIDKYLMASESRLISSKAVSAIHSDLGVFFFL